MGYKNPPHKKRNTIWEVSSEELKEVVKNSTSLSDVIRYYGLQPSSGRYTILKARLRQDDIDFSHIKLGIRSNRGRGGLGPKAYPLDLVLVENSAYSRKRLKARLLKGGLLNNQCYECEIGPEWNGKPLSLQIDHINGVSDDNRIENLRMLCPNCHSQTETFGGKRGIKV